MKRPYTLKSIELLTNSTAYRTTTCWYRFDENKEKKIIKYFAYLHHKNASNQRKSKLQLHVHIFYNGQQINVSIKMASFFFLPRTELVYRKFVRYSKREWYVFRKHANFTATNLSWSFFFNFLRMICLFCAYSCEVRNF